MTTETEAQLLELMALDPDGPSVVALGGGHGLEQVLNGVQGYAGSIAAIVTVADDGGSSGRLTQAIDIPPPGDLRRCLLALSPEPGLWSEMFEFRFQEGDVKGHSLGNLLLAAMSDLYGDFETALSVAEEALGAIGVVIPASKKSLRLQAVIDGNPVDGQAAISRQRGRLTELRLLPEVDAVANPRAVASIAEADQIIIGPGSLFTSVISTVMVPGMADAINESQAQLVYVCNVTCQDGESLGLSASDHARHLIEFTGLDRRLTMVVHSGGESDFPAEAIPVAPPGDLSDLAVIVEKADLVDHTADWPQHDPIKLGIALRKLWENRA